MASSDFQSLLGLSDDEALRTHQQRTNRERLRLLGGVLAVGAFGGLLTHLFYADWLRLLPPLLLFAVVRWAFADQENVEPISDGVLVATLTTLFALVVFLPPQLSFGLEAVAVLGALAVVFFRLPTFWATLLLTTIFVGTAIPRWYLLPERSLQDLIGPRFLVALAFAVLSLVLTVRSTRAASQRFEANFRIESSRNRERQRMRDELSSARQIQLSMLPQQEPQFRGLDISAASLPAAEVGGDYYEYFAIDDRRLAIVLADVAGHGVASGLLLSGVRSCLHLLHADGIGPRSMLEKLDRMLRATTQRRMFVTMVYAVVDLDRMRLTHASAGHPAILRYVAATGEVLALDNPALPLGTRLECTYCQLHEDLEPGDVLILYTDGLTETNDGNDGDYGEERLRERLRRVARGRTARQIREAILSDVWNFKGNSEQLDDLTLVAIRLDEAGGESYPVDDS